MVAVFFGGLFLCLHHLTVKLDAAFQPFLIGEDFHFSVRERGFGVIGQFLFKPVIKIILICPVGFQTLTLTGIPFQEQAQVGVVFCAAFSVKTKGAAPFIKMGRALYINIKTQSGFFIQLVQNKQNICQGIQADFLLLKADQFSRLYIQNLRNLIDYCDGGFNFSALILLNGA